MKLASTIKGVYAITPDCVDSADVLHRARMALAGGVKILQYRNKSANCEQRVEQAYALRMLTREFGALFIVNDDARLAAHVDADGVHLGATDDSVKVARTLLGMQKIIGVSCYNHLALAHDAVNAGADYVAFGAFFPSSVKPRAAVATVGLLRQARRELNVPLVAIGGITLRNAGMLLHAGASALAMISALFQTEDITDAVKKMSSLFEQHPQNGISW